MIYPSVTQALKPYTDPLLAAVPPALLEQASARGRDVHRICCAMARGAWVPGIPEECAGYVESWQRWSEKYVDRILMTEPELINHRLRFMGHPDLVAIMKGDQWVSVIDFKIPRQMRNSWRIQLSAYGNLVEEAGWNVARSFSLRLNPDGKPPLVDEFTGTMPQDFAVFCGLLAGWWFFNPEGVIRKEEV